MNLKMRVEEADQGVRYSQGEQEENQQTP